MHMLTASTSFFDGKKFDDTRPKGKREVNVTQSVGMKEENSVQLIETKEVNSNESLNGSIKSVEPQDQQKDSSVMKTGASVTESVQQQQNISETRNEEFPKRTRIAAGAERDGVKEDIKAVVQLEETSNETKNSAVSSYVNHPSEGHCFVIGSNWREFYAIPILNTCNVPLCSTGRTGRDRFRNRLLIKKCRNK
ncbi:hypothetical protein WUBG_13469 [Wuchereria bancrofti]|nr:hypothetical protein WUBG_13469 [Wuchereria bancrofti]